MRVLLLTLFFVISLGKEHVDNRLWETLDGKTPAREEALAENTNGNLFDDLLFGKITEDFDDTEEAVAGLSAGGFFRRLVKGMWGTVVKTVERAFEDTGMSKVVHMVTHGKRLFNEDGSYNNQLAAHVFQNTVRVVETVFDDIGLDNAVHAITGGGRLYNPKTGEWDSTIQQALEEGKRIMEVFKNTDDIEKITEYSVKMAESLFGSLESLWTIFKKDMDSTIDAFRIVTDVLSGTKRITDPETKREVENYFNDIAMKAIKKIQYRCGLADIKGANQEPIGTVMVGTNAEVDFIGGASVGRMAAVSIPFPGSETVEFGGYWTVGLDFGFQYGAAVSFPICYSWNEKPSGIAGFGITVSTGFSTPAVGFGVDVSWALITKPVHEFKLNTICIQYKPGAQFELAVQASYTGELFDVAQINLRPPTDAEIGVVKTEQDAIEGHWVKCADEGQNCKCYGTVRYGGPSLGEEIPTEKWNVMDKYEGGPKSIGIPCTRKYFGEGITGVEDIICECQSYVESLGYCGQESSGYWLSYDDTCRCSHGIIRIGKGSKWSQWMKVGTSTTCSNDNLGDPAVGTRKECQCGIERIPTAESESTVGEIETDMAFDAVSTKTFPWNEAMYFFAAIGVVATGVAMYNQLYQGDKYQEVHSEI